ncbi:MAG: ABC transporter permease [bacterium]
MPRSLRQFYGFFISSFKSLLRTPSAWVFGFAFPVIFILLFGFISNNSQTEIKVGFLNDDTPIYSTVKSSFEKVKIFKVTQEDDFDGLNSKLQNGDLDAIIRFNRENSIQLISNANKPENVSVVQQALEKANDQITFEKNSITAKSFTITNSEVNSRKSRYIDFVLPGILGYSVMSAAIFGVAFSFVSLRKENVLKRIFAGPTRVAPFILGQSFSRMIYIFLQNIALITVAIVAFNFSPRNNWSSLWQILVMIVIGLIVFLGFGYVVAGTADSEESVSPLANLVVIPQFILAGTFFPISALPDWLGKITSFLPLYYFNEAVRLISIDGLNLWDLKVALPVAGLMAWGVVIYYTASKVFRVK